MDDIFEADDIKVFKIRCCDTKSCRESYDNWATLSSLFTSIKWFVYIEKNWSVTYIPLIGEGTVCMPNLKQEGGGDRI